MTPETFLAWLKGWVARHPVKTPPEGSRTSYTRDVMARVERPASQPRGAGSNWLAWWRPRAAFQLGLAAAAVLIAVTLSPRRSAQLADHTPSASPIVVAESPIASEPAIEPKAVPSDRGEVIGPLVLAEQPSDNEAWINQTLELLKDLEEEPDASAEDGSIEEWLQELQELDDVELASS